MKIKLDAEAQKLLKDLDQLGLKVVLFEHPDPNLDGIRIDGTPEHGTAVDLSSLKSILVGYKNNYKRYLPDNQHYFWKGR